MKLLKNQNGNGIIGSTVAAALTAITMAAVMTVGDSSIKLQSNAMGALEFDRFSYLLKTLFSNEKMCSANFDGWLMDASKLNISQPIASIGKDEKQSNFSHLFLYDTTKTPPQVTTKLLGVGDSLGGIEIKAIQFNLLTRLNPQSVNGTLEVLGQGATGSKSMSLPLNFIIAEGEGPMPITGCSSNLSYGVVAGDCGDNQYVQGIEVNGDLICKKLGPDKEAKKFYVFQVESDLFITSPVIHTYGGVTVVEFLREYIAPNTSANRALATDNPQAFFDLANPHLLTSTNHYRFLGDKMSLYPVNPESDSIGWVDSRLMCSPSNICHSNNSWLDRPILGNTVAGPYSYPGGDNGSAARFDNLSVISGVRFVALLDAEAVIK